MNTILAGTDFSEISQRVVKVAHELARALSARLHLVHVVEPIAEPGAEDPDAAEFHLQLEERALVKLRELALPMAATYEVVLGRRAETLLKLAEQHEATLVLGCPRLGPDRLPLIGTSQRLVWMTRLPILLVP